MSDDYVMEGWRLARAPVLSAMVLLALGVVNLSYPICGDALGVSLVLGPSTIGSIVFVGNVFMFHGWWKRRTRTAANKLEWRDLRWFPVFLLGALCAMLADDREHKAARWQWTFDGVITDKYRSTNHGAYSVRIDGVPYEYVSKSFWTSIDVGDHVVKNACSPQVRVGGQLTAIIGE
jgi:hypothetical protein